MAIVDQWVQQLTNGGGPAFPVIPPQPGNAGFSGMTLRDYFAAAAMQGMTSNPRDGICTQRARRSKRATPSQWCSQPPMLSC